MNLKLTLAGALLSLALASPSFAASPYHPGAHPGGFFPPKPKMQWELIGQRNVNLFSGRETIQVRGNERYSQVMLCVYNRTLRLNDFDVRFQNGGSQDVSVRNTIQAGSCTRAIDLKGQKRDIKSVSLAAKAMGFGRGAVVKVFAR